MKTVSLIYRSDANKNGDEVELELSFCFRKMKGLGCNAIGVSNTLIVNGKTPSKEEAIELLSKPEEIDPVGLCRMFLTLAHTITSQMEKNCKQISGIPESVLENISEENEDAVS